MTFRSIPPSAVGDSAATDKDVRIPAESFLLEKKICLINFVRVCVFADPPGVWRSEDFSEVRFLLPLGF